MQEEELCMKIQGVGQREQIVPITEESKEVVEERAYFFAYSCSHCDDHGPLCCYQKVLFAVCHYLYNSQWQGKEQDVVSQDQKQVIIWFQPPLLFACDVLCFGLTKFGSFFFGTNSTRIPRSECLRCRIILFVYILVIYLNNKTCSNRKVRDSFS